MNRRLTLIMALAALLRLVNIGQESLWFDEAFTAWVTKPGTDFWRAVIGDTHPPLWSMLQWLSARLFGQGEVAFRVWAAVFSVASVYLIYRLAMRISYGDEKLSLTATLIAAIMPAFIYFGQDGRMYAALGFFVLLTAYWLLESERLWVLSALLAMYTHTSGVLYVVAIASAVILKDISASQGDYLRYTIARFAPDLIAISIFYAPYLFVLTGQMHSVKDSFWLPPLELGGALFPFELTTAGWRLPQSAQVWVYATFAGMTIIGIVVFLKQESKIYEKDIAYKHWKSSAVMFGGFLVAPLLLAIVSLVWRNIYVFRAIYPAALLIPILWAYALTKTGKENRQWAQLLIIPALVVALISHYFPNSGRGDVTHLQSIRDQWVVGDAVLYVDGDVAIADGWYMQDQPIYISDHQLGNIVTVSEECRSAFGFIRSNIADLWSRGYKRVWVLFNSSAYTSQGNFDLRDQIVQSGGVVIRHDEGERPQYYSEVLLIEAAQ